MKCDYAYSIARNKYYFKTTFIGIEIGIGIQSHIDQNQFWKLAKFNNWTIVPPAK